MKIWKSTVAYTGLFALLFGGFSSAFAADNSLRSMFKDWAGDASGLVSSNMKYPDIGVGQREESAIQIYRVTVDHVGQIKGYGLVTLKGQRRFVNASDRLLNRLDNFPQLPREYDSDELTFVLVMDYDASPRQTRSVWETYNATRTKIFDVSGKRINDDIVMLGAGTSFGR